jgi:ATP synthase protein I
VTAEARPPNGRRLQDAVERQLQRMRRARRERPTLLSQTVFLGTLGLVFVLPVIAGAYLGRWLDESLPGYSVRWTLSMICVGLVVGGMNVYMLFRESHDER